MHISKVSNIPAGLITSAIASDHTCKHSTLDATCTGSAAEAAGGAYGLPGSFVTESAGSRLPLPACWPVTDIFLPDPAASGSHRQQVGPCLLQPTLSMLWCWQPLTCGIMHVYSTSLQAAYFMTPSYQYMLGSQQACSRCPATRPWDRQSMQNSSSLSSSNSAEPHMCALPAGQTT